MITIRDVNNISTKIRLDFIESIEKISKVENIIRMVSGKEYIIDSHELFIIEDCQRR